MRSFHLAVQLRRAPLDVGVTDAEILDVPMELRLELMAIVGSDLTNAERELVDDMIYEVDCIGLGMLFIDL